MAGLSADILFRMRSSGTRRVERDFDRLQRKATGLRSSLSFLRGALVVFASTAVLSQFTQFADSLTLIQNRIRLVTDSVTELTAVQKALYDISQETRSSFSANADLFNRLARSTTDLNYTFRENLALTRAINQALQISGATSQEARSSVVQFAQGLASGELRAQELESVTENAQRLAQVIASAAGMSAGALRSFARTATDSEIQEVLGREAVIRAIEAAYDDLGEEFEDLDRTIGQALTQLSNKFIVFFGQLNRQTAIGRLIIDTIDGIRNNLALLITTLAAFAGITVFNLVLTQVLLLNTRLRVAVYLLGGAAFRGAAAAWATLVAPISLLYSAVNGLGTALAFLIRGSLAAVPAALVALSSAAKAGTAALLALRGVMTAGVVGAFTKSLVAGAVPAVIALTKTVAVSAAAFLMHPLILGSVAGIAAIIVGFRTFSNLVEFVTGSFETLGSIADSVVVFIATGVTTVIRNWRVLPKAFANIAVRATNALVETVLDGVNKITGWLNSLTSWVGLPEIPKAEFDSFTEPYKKAAEQVSEDFQRIRLEVENAGGGFEFAKDKATDFYNYFKNLTTLPTVDMSVLDNLPDVPRQSGESTGSDKEAQKSLEKELDDIQRVISALDPYQDAMGQLTEQRDLLNRAVERGVLSQQEGVELMRRAGREAAGVGNAVVEYAAQQRLLNEQLEEGSLSQIEFASASRQSARDLTGSLGAYADAVDRLASRRVELANGVSQELITQSRMNELMRQAQREAAGVSNATAAFAEKQKILDKALSDNVLSLQEYQRALAEARGEMLREDTSARGGVERFFNDLTLKASDAASQVESLLSTAFRGAEDAFVDFTQTGELSFKNLINSMTEDLTRMAFRTSINTMANSFGAPGAGSAQGGLLGSIASAIGGLFGPGRAQGGSVYPGDMRPVNERGAPELLTAGNRDYLMMGSTAGRVTPLTDAGRATVGPNADRGGPPTVINQAQFHVEYVEAEGKTPEERDADQESFWENLRLRWQGWALEDLSERGKVSRSYADVFDFNRKGRK